MTNHKPIYKHLPALDGLRGVAISIVVFHHFASLAVGSSSSLFWKLVERTFEAGWLGVDIFFVLSGYLITGIILSERGEPRFWQNFYLRRVFRILPAFILVFSTCLLIARYSNIQAILLYTLFAANWGIVIGAEIPFLTHIWSLAIEEQFYFLWPQLAVRLSAKALSLAALGIALVSELIRVIMALEHVNPYITYKITFSRLDGLAIGAALAVGVKVPSVVSFLTKYWRVALTAGIGALLATFLFLHLSLWAWDVRAQMFAIPSAVIAVAATIFAVSIGQLPPLLDGALTSRMLTYLGRRSYGIYLIHDPVRYLFVNTSLARNTNLYTHIGLAVCGITISILLAELSWRLVEQPMQNVGKRLRSVAAESASVLAVEAS